MQLNGGAAVELASEDDLVTRACPIMISVARHYASASHRNDLGGGGHAPAAIRAARLLPGARQRGPLRLRLRLPADDLEQRKRANRRLDHRPSNGNLRRVNQRQPRLRARQSLG